MAEIDLMDRYPRSPRPLEGRASHKLPAMIERARQFGKDYFDGDRLYGYGGYSYHPRFWTETVKRFRDYYRLADDTSVLDVGCAKGFMMYDFKKLMPQMTIAGVDVSAYAMEHAIEEMKPFIRIGDAKKLPYADRSFDLVVSIHAIHNLPPVECKQALREIQRVTKKHAYVAVDAWQDEEEKKRLLQWNLTALTAMHTDEWKNFFKEAGYQGDYGWFTP